jgi:hypothetical protein
MIDAGGSAPAYGTVYSCIGMTCAGRLEAVGLLSQYKTGGLYRRTT